MQHEERTAVRILPPKITAHRIGVHVRTLQRMVRDGEFVRPIKVSRNRIGFLETAVNSWIASRPEAA
jgi:predicted DNA-binding transcriptional regulator AlpA